mmetsp:Transcript_37549/g.73538  ORF Transcript_37549/g.73538 Transcript_37549/m.73538 type:complete len:95 (+) Transcript_37549:145-429(+)
MTCVIAKRGQINLCEAFDHEARAGGYDGGSPRVGAGAAEKRTHVEGWSATRGRHSGTATVTAAPHSTGTDVTGTRTGPLRAPEGRHTERMTPTP